MTLIDSTIRRELVRVLKEYPEILFAILYGSAVEVGHPHDLDIGLYVDRARLLPIADLDYAFALAEELERKLPYLVDVRIINESPLGFRYNVSQGQPLLVNDQAAFFQFLERTWDEWFDFEPVAMQYIRELR